MKTCTDLLPIRDVARRSGKTASSIRYYERMGLIPAPVRLSGRRQFPPAVLRTLAIIETGQRAGLTLHEISVLLTSSDDADAADRLRQVAERKLPEVRALIERAQLVRGWLEAAAGCTCPSLDDCPLFDEPEHSLLG